jgi:hypothetical protein
LASASFSRRALSCASSAYCRSWVDRVFSTSRVMNRQVT